MPSEANNELIIEQVVKAIKSSETNLKVEELLKSIDDKNRQKLIAILKSIK